MPTTDADAPDDDTLPPPARGGANHKLQRWIDLTAELLARSSPASFEELARGVPEYLARLDEAVAAPDDVLRKTILASLKRTFERDKDELRDFGVPIESMPDADGNEGGRYRLRRPAFYLPYLCFAVPGGDVTKPEPVDHYGYRALASLTFDADELQAVVDAAAIVRALGDPLLANEADSALRKLAVDLPIDAVVAASGEPRIVLPRPRPDAAIFEALSGALARRKIASFPYRAMSSGRTEEREVEPYGLFFLNGHWYLAARDRQRNALRNFRLNRIERVSVNGKRAQSADYDIAPDFRLRDHARSRHAWELGDGDAMNATVDFVGESGATMAAMKLGAPVPSEATQRTFEVRRLDTFVRWAMSFAGEVAPVAPEEVVRRYEDEVAATLRGYDGREAPAGGDIRPSLPDATVRSAREAWQPGKAAAQLRRILHVIPLIADGEEHDLRSVAAQVGEDVETLRRDLYSIVARFDAPGGFVEGVQLFVEPDRVSAVANHFRRPMRLTIPELCALELGLAVLRAQRPPDEHPVLDRARERLRAVISRLPGDSIPDGLHGASLGEHGSTAHLAAVQGALRQRRKLRLVYRRSGSATPGARVICPYGLVAASGMLYIVAHCEQSESVRVFRMDRVEEAEVTAEAFTRPDDFSLDAVVSEARVLHHAGAATMRVRYSPRVAPWIAEREGRKVEDDGSLVIDHPLADWEWGMRHVLQYGPEAEVLSPPDFRERLRERLSAMMARGRAGAGAE